MSSNNISEIDQEYESCGSSSSDLTLQEKIIDVSEKVNERASKMERNKVNKVIEDDNNIDYYTTRDKGPYYVIAYKENMNIIRLGKDLNRINLKTVINIFRIGKNKAKIEIKEISEANKILRSLEIKKTLGYEFSIPLMYIRTIGIIRDIPKELSNKEIYENLEVDKGVRLMNVERLKRWNFDKKIEEDTEIVKISFRANYLPGRVRLYNTNIRTQYFIPNPIFCTKCLKYGHIKKFCKNIAKCRTCAEEIIDVHNCSLINKCNLCKDNHKTNFRECIYKKNEIEIQKVIVKEKKSYTEARRIVPAIRKPDFNVQQTNFPELTYAKATNETAARHDKVILKTNIDPTKYEEITNILKKKDILIQLTAQIISNLFDEKNVGKCDAELIKLMEIYRNNPAVIEQYTNF